MTMFLMGYLALMSAVFTVLSGQALLFVWTSGPRQVGALSLPVSGVVLFGTLVAVFGRAMLLV